MWSAGNLLSLWLRAERALTSCVTLQRVEQGDPAVSIGIYAAVLHALGLVERLGEVADPGTTRLGRRLFIRGRASASP